MKLFISIGNGLDDKMMLSVRTEIIWYTAYEDFNDNVRAINSPNHVQFGRFVNSAKRSIHEVTSAKVSGKFMWSFLNAYRSMITFWTA